MSSLSNKIARVEAAAPENIDAVDIELQRKRWQLELKRFDGDTTDRKWLAKWATVLVTCWLTAVMLLLSFCSIGESKLSDTVLITLLGTTTLNVLGLTFIVLRGHFGTRN